MTHRPWLATYRECGIPAEINPDAYVSVVQMLERAMTVHAEKPAFRSFGQTLTYAEVDRQSRNFVSYLQMKLGVRKGDRIAVMMLSPSWASSGRAACRLTSIRYIRRVSSNISSAMPASRSSSFSRGRRQPWRK